MTLPDRADVEGGDCEDEDACDVAAVADGAGPEDDCVACLFGCWAATDALALERDGAAAAPCRKVAKKVERKKGRCEDMLEVIDRVGCLINRWVEGRSLSGCLFAVFDGLGRGGRRRRQRRGAKVCLSRQLSRDALGLFPVMIPI
jgi:hypothetical protein